MLSLTSEQLAALSDGKVIRRTFIYCEARDPDTGDPSPAGFWDDVGAVELSGRTYYGSQLFSVSTLSAKSDLSIPALAVTLSGVATEAINLVRGTSLSQAPIEVAIGLFDPATRTVLAPLITRFIGFVDEVEIKTPEAGGTCTIGLTCESASRALTIKRTGTRSPETHAARNPSDLFFNYTPALREQTIYFGRRDPNAKHGKNA